jgi:biotin transport system substrate-specific component
MKIQSHGGSASSISAGKPRISLWLHQIALIISGSLLVAICARVSIPLPWTPVPFTLSNFGVLLVGLLLGSRAGGAALLLYLAEGSLGLPVFSAGSLGIMGPTGGFLLAYPVVAFIAGWVSERGEKTFSRAALASVLAEIVLFAIALSWLVAVFHVPLRRAADWGLYPFLLVEVVKMAAASAIASRWLRSGRLRS